MLACMAKRTGLQPETCNARQHQIIGGRTRTRTLDPLIKSQLLYQLSYAPFAFALENLAW